jgi:hypothetical protein
MVRNTFNLMEGWVLIFYTCGFLGLCAIVDNPKKELLKLSEIS